MFMGLSQLKALLIPIYVQCDVTDRPTTRKNNFFVFCNAFLDADCMKRCAPEYITYMFYGEKVCHFFDLLATACHNPKRPHIVKKPRLGVQSRYGILYIKYHSVNVQIWKHTYVYFERSNIGTSTIPAKKSLLHASKSASERSIVLHAQYSSVQCWTECSRSRFQSTS